MIPEFKGISENEFNQLREAIALITVLIAGADGEIEKDEKEWALKVTKIRSYSLPAGMKEFYKAVGADFSEVLEATIQKYRNLPVKERSLKLSEKLSELNDIFAKLDDRRIAAKLYKSFKSFARHVAKSTGGILGFLTIGPEESNLIHLPMLKPIAYFVNEGEEEE